ncbi:MAG: hypothetical protein WBD59_12745, partial [Candidatus Sulfotelmatobacter sp.]
TYSAATVVYLEDRISHCILVAEAGNILEELKTESRGCIRVRARRRRPSNTVRVCRAHIPRGRDIGGPPPRKGRTAVGSIWRGRCEAA